jgi:hypothetical protein
MIESLHDVLYYGSMETKNSPAKIKANNKYTKDHYKRYSVYLPIEEAERMEAIKGSSSANGFILEAVREKIRQQETPEIIREPWTD